MQYYDIEKIKKEHKPGKKLPIILTLISLLLSIGLFAWGISITNAHIAEGIEAEEEALIDAGHFGTEKIFAENFAAQLRVLTPELNVVESVINSNPYLID